MANPTAYFELAFRLSNHVNKYERVVYNIWHYFGDIGGFIEIFKVLGIIIMSSYAENLYIASLIKRMYRVRP